ncbi:MAG: TolB family protein, partial [Anaerolineae bacterium]
MNRIETGFRRLVMYTVGGVALLGFILFLRALFMAQSVSDGDISSVAGDPLGATFLAEAGDQLQPAWSPDGRYLAYVSLRDARSYLFRRDLLTNEVIQIAADARSPIWSPDRTHLAYG